MSSVDSGNLAAALLTLADGLRELASGRAGPDRHRARTRGSRRRSSHRAITSGRSARQRRRPRRSPAARRRRVERFAGSSADVATSRDEKLAHAGRPSGRLEAVAADLDAGPDALARRRTSRTGRARLAERHRRPRSGRRRSRGPTRAARAPRDAFADGMNFRLLYDEQRGLLSIGYRPADAEGPGRLDTRVLRSARLRSAAGQLRRDRQGRRPRNPLVPARPADHERRRRADAALVGRDDVRVPDAAARHAQLSGDAARRDLPDGRAAADPVRRGARRAVGHLRVRVQRRRPPRHVSIQGLRRARPRTEARARRRSRRRAVRHGAGGDARAGARRGETSGGSPPRASTARTGTTTRSTTRRAAAIGPKATRAASIRSHGVGRADVDGPPPGHDAGRRSPTRCSAIAMVERFHADPRVKATELLLQERIPRLVPVTQPRPLEATRVATPVGRRRRPPIPLRRPRRSRTRRSCRTATTSRSSPTPAAASSRCRGRSVTRDRRDATRDPGSQFIYLRDVRTGAVWSATAQPFGSEPQDYLVTLAPERVDVPPRRRRHRDEPRHRRLDRRRRRSAARCRSRTTAIGSREIDVTSYAEIVLATPAADLAHPAFGKLFVETEYLPECSALLCRRRPGGHDADEVWAVHVLSLEGRPHGRARMRNRSRPLPRPRTRPRRSAGPRRPVALEHRRRDARSDCQPAPAGAARRRADSRGCRSSPAWPPISETALALAQKYREPSASARTFALAATHGQSTAPAPRHLERRCRCCTSGWRRACSTSTARCAPSADVQAQNTLGREALWAHGISGDLPIVLVRVGEEDALPLIRQVPRSAGVLAAEGPERRHRDPQRASGRATSTKRTSRSCTLLDDGPWRGWKDRPGGVYLLRGDQMAEAERTLLASVARAILHGNRGTLANQIDRPRPRPRDRREPGPAVCRIRAPAPSSDHAAAPIAAPPLTLSNGLGGFTTDGKDYVIVLDGDQETPLPWVNVIANPGFGTIVSASGSAFTWAENSRENRLTPFCERSGHRSDRRSDLHPRRRHRRSVVADAWSDAPNGVERPTVVTHSAGVTTFQRVVSGIEHELNVFVDRSDPVKMSLLTLTNRGQTPRRLSIFGYDEWWLGPPQVDQQTHVTTELDAESGAVLAQERVQPRLRRLRRVRACQRDAGLGDRRSAFVSRPQRVAGAAGGAPAPSAVAALRRRTRSVRRAARRRCRWRPGKRGGSSSCSVRAPTCRAPRDLIRPLRPRRGRRREPDGGSTALGRNPERRSGQNAGRLVRPDDEPLAALPDDQLPAVGAVGLLPAGRRLRVPRSAAGRRWRSRWRGPTC